MSKWMLYRAGIFDFWHYKEEVFNLKDGKMLLRGSNGSGKSVTMQSFIPLLLDGNKSPERLDPFGSKSRKIENYLFGENNEKIDRIGYLFLEYKKEDADEYITTGIGLQSSKSSEDISFWGFIINNLRINYDLNLYTEGYNNEGKQVKIARNKKQLDVLLQECKCGKVVSEPKDYAELVNNNIFKYKSLQGYRELINLLLQIRTPKLSNKEFKPKDMYEILKNSLPDLSYSDLRSLSETIETIDDMKAQLEKLQNDYGTLQKISQIYDDYNLYLITDKANEYLESHKRLDTGKIKKRDTERALERTQNDLVSGEQRLNELKNEAEALEEQIRSLQKHKVFDLKSNLENCKINETNLKDQINNKDESIKRRETNERNYKSKLERLEEKKDGIVAKIDLTLSDMANLAQNMQFAIHDILEDQFKNKYQSNDVNEILLHWDLEIKKHRKLLNQILELIRSLETIRNDQEKLTEEIEKLSVAAEEIKKRIEEEEKHFDSEINQIRTDIGNWNKGNQELLLNDAEIAQIYAGLDELFDTVQPEEIIKIITDKYLTIYKTLTREETVLKQEQLTQENEIEKIKREIKAWQEMIEPEPERPIETTERRRILMLNTIPFIPFFSAVDFKANISLEKKERIEAALVEMGILDALIVPPEYYDLVDEDDRIIKPMPLRNQRTLLDILEPTPNPQINVSEEHIKEVLQSIALDDNSLSFVTLTGHYKNAVLEGYAVKTQASRYIGKEAQEQYKQRMISELQDKLAELSKKWERLNSKLLNTKERINTLEQEKQSITGFEKTKQIFTQLEKLFHELSVNEKRLTDLDEKKKELNSRFRETRGKLTEQAQNISLAKTMESYTTALAEIDEYNNYYIDLKLKGNDYAHCQREINSTNQYLADLEVQILEAKGELNILRNELNKINQKIIKLEEALKLNKAEEIEAQIAKAITRKRQIPEDQEKQIKKNSEYSNKIMTFNEQLLILTKEINFHKTLSEAWEKVFLAEVFTRLVQDINDSQLETSERIIECAKKLVKDFKDEILQMDFSKIEADLSQVYYQNERDLVEYIPSIKNSDEVLPEIETYSDVVFLALLERLKNRLNRKYVSLVFDGKEINPYSLAEKIKEKIELQNLLLTKEDERLFREVILHNVGDKIRTLINQAENWREDINSLMEKRNTSSGLRLWLEWKPKPTTEEGEIETAELVKLLMRNPDTLKESDFAKLSKHFNTKIKIAKELLEEDENNNKKTLEDMIKDVLDYRKWFEFKLYYSLRNLPKAELTTNKFSQLSGGERALAIYIPLFSAVYSKYQDAGEVAPFIITLDEAFAGVDENNIRDMFELIEDLGFNYMMNSQSLWGDYDTVNSLNIYELQNPQNGEEITVIPYYWNGHSLNLDIIT